MKPSRFNGRLHEPIPSDAQQLTSQLDSTGSVVPPLSQSDLPPVSNPAFDETTDQFEDTLEAEAMISKTSSGVQTSRASSKTKLN